MLSELVSASRLKNNTGQVPGLPKNPRLIKDEKFDKLKKSIQDDPEMLELREVIAYEFNGELVVIAGNMRLKACTELGIKQIPTKILPPTTPVEKLKAYTIKDNVPFGENDWEAIQADWPEAEEWGLDIPDAFKVVPEAVEDDYEIPDVIETDIVLGDLFEIGNHRLLCGDSTCGDTVAKLMNGAKADMVFTDPPYGVDYSSQHVGLYSNGSNQTKSRDVILNDKDTKSIIEFMPLLKEFCNGIAYIFCGAGKELDLLQSIKDNKYELINTLIWNKQKGTGALNANYKPCFELFYYIKVQGDRLWNGNNSEWTVWDIEYKKDNTLHPTQKPIALIEKALKNHNSKSILDFFLGSGSTMVAAHQLNRKCYGMELDPKYCQVIIDRMRKLDPALVIKKNGLPLTYDD